MLFRTACLSTVALLCVNQAVGATLEVRGVDAILIASDAYYACNCPDNCNLKKGSDFKYYAGPSSLSQVITGKCYPENDGEGALTCIATN